MSTLGVEAMYSKRDSVKMDAEWRAESDMRTMCEAGKIRKDPKRLKAVQEMAKKKLADAKETVGEVAEILADKD